MLDYITPEQCESLGMVHRTPDRWACPDVPVVVKWRDGCAVLTVGSRRPKCKPTLTNVERLLRALRGEMSDEERALWALRQLNEPAGRVSLTWDNERWQVEEWVGQNYIATADTPLAAVEAAAKALGGEVPGEATPSNDELLGWTKKSQPLPEIMKEEEDRPW